MLPVAQVIKDVSAVRLTQIMPAAKRLETSPTGAGILSDMGERRINIHVIDDGVWLDKTPPGVLGSMSPNGNLLVPQSVFDGTLSPRIMVPGKDLGAHPVDSVARIIGHELVHRNDMPLKASLSKMLVKQMAVEPWKRAGAAVVGATRAARAGSSPLHGALDGARRYALRDETRAAALDHQVLRELDAARGGTGLDPEVNFSAQQIEDTNMAKAAYQSLANTRLAMSGIGIGVQGVAAGAVASVAAVAGKRLLARMVQHAPHLAAGGPVAR